MCKIIAGLDIGNGYVKANMRTGENVVGVHFPSSVAFVTNPHNIPTENDALKGVIDDIYNQMDVSFDSQIVKDTGRRLFGSRGVASGMSLEEFDVYSHVSKAHQDLSGILILGTLAGKALQDYFGEHNALPNDIVDVTARIALALPIREFKRYRSTYAKSFTSADHMVNFHNFEKPVRVRVRFENVQVFAEGASAQYAITAKGAPFMEAMLSDVRRMGEPLPGITAQDILAVRNTVGIDIGEGTVNFPVFQDGVFNADSSGTFDSGYGTVLNTALDRLQDEGFAFKSRKDLSNFLQTPPTALNRARYNKVKQIVTEETQAFANEVSMQFVKIMSRVGSFAEVVYVYGGGANPLREVLYPLLIETSKNFGGVDTSYPVLYLDSRYSQHLNREGLYIVADGFARSEAQKATQVQAKPVQK
ncbi:MAG: ParM/StbA family protein [Clostridia bacterium]|nr:ParM/StbA family protein [Clostridia bacterium]